jgi:hypothetical protein
MKERKKRSGERDKKERDQRDRKENNCHIIKNEYSMPSCPLGGKEKNLDIKMG